MIIFLYGPDAYRSKQKLTEITKHYQDSQKSGLNLTQFNATQADFSDFYQNLTTVSMFKETKLTIIKDLFLSKKFQEDFMQRLADINSLKDVVVIYESEAVDQRLKLFKILIKECKNQEFTLLEGGYLRAWVQKEFGAQKINVDATNLLIQYVGNDLWQLSGEINKLINFKKGLVIKKEDVELLVRPRIESDIFKTIDALGALDKKQALKLIQKHLDNGDAPLYLLTMIAFQFKNLLVVKELAERGLMYNSIVKKSGLHPFVVKKDYFQCSQFSLTQLKEIYYKIFQCDLDIKTGKTEPELALDILISKI